MRGFVWLLWSSVSAAAARWARADSAKWPELAESVVEACVELVCREGNGGAEGGAVGVVGERRNSTAVPCPLTFYAH